MVAADGKKAISPVETHVDESPPLSGRSLPEAETKSLVREAVKDTSIIRIVNKLTQVMRNQWTLIVCV